MLMLLKYSMGCALQLSDAVSSRLRMTLLPSVG